MVQGFYVSHIAIDYNPQWFEDNDVPSWIPRWVDLHGTVGFAIRAATGQLEWAENLWFVDYRIRRRLPTATSGRRTFYGNGCKFSEVRDGDIKWELDHSENVFKFLEEVAFEDSRHRKEYASEDDSDTYDRPKVGVLAYEEDET